MEKVREIIRTLEWSQSFTPPVRSPLRVIHLASLPPSNPRLTPFPSLPLSLIPLSLLPQPQPGVWPQTLFMNICSALNIPQLLPWWKGSCPFDSKINMPAQRLWTRRFIPSRAGPRCDRPSWRFRLGWAEQNKRRRWKNLLFVTVCCQFQWLTEETIKLLKLLFYFKGMRATVVLVHKHELSWKHTQTWRS